MENTVYFDSKSVYLQNIKMTTKDVNIKAGIADAKIQDF